MVMSTKKIVRGIDKSLNKAVSEINASTPKPEMKDTGELKAAVAPKKAETFAEAFRAARKEGKKTFSWAGKPGTTFTTDMAGEGAKRPASTRSSGSKTGSGSSSASSSPVADFYTKGYSKVKGNAANIQGAGPMATGKNNAKSSDKSVAKLGSPVNAGRSKGFLSRLFTKSADSDFAKSQERKYGKRTPLLLVGEEAREANRKQGTIGGKAKGGKIDGCAVRGKTRAGRK